jgi:hypothetical protein
MKGAIVMAGAFDCLEVLDLSGQTITAECVIESFHKLFTGREKPARDLFQARDILVKNEVEKQMAASPKRFFRITPNIPDKCESCSGTGKIFLFEREEIVEDCRTCKGSGNLIIACKDCGGEGKFHHQIAEKGDDEDAEVKTSVECITCKGTGKAEVKCITCLGEGTKRKSMKKAKVQSADRCKACRGYGFKTNDAKPATAAPKKRFNPVISQSLAEQIKKS